MVIIPWNKIHIFNATSVLGILKEDFVDFISTRSAIFLVSKLIYVFITQKCTLLLTENMYSKNKTDFLTFLSHEFRILETILDVYLS